MTTECPSCGEQSSQSYRCEHCGRDLVDERDDQEDVATDGGTILEEGEEPSSVAELRVAIGDELGLDLRERMQSVGRHDSAVVFRKRTLVMIAWEIPNRTGDAQDVRQLGVDELRQWIARQLQVDAPNGGVQFRYGELRAIYDALADRRLYADGGVEPGYYVVDEAAGVVLEGPREQHRDAVREVTDERQVVVHSDQLDTLDVEDLRCGAAAGQTTLTARGDNA